MQQSTLRRPEQLFMASRLWCSMKSHMAANSFLWVTTYQRSVPAKKEDARTLPYVPWSAMDLLSPPVQRSDGDGATQNQDVIFPMPTQESSTDQASVSRACCQVFSDAFTGPTMFHWMPRASSDRTLQDRVSDIPELVVLDLRDVTCCVKVASVGLAAHALLPHRCLQECWPLGAPKTGAAVWYHTSLLPRPPRMDRPIWCEAPELEMACFVWYRLAPLGIGWYHLVPLGIVGYHSEPLGTTWYHSPLGTTWCHLVPLGNPETNTNPKHIIRRPDCHNSKP